jgi:phosphatidylglycerol lysyltransferase
LHVSGLAARVGGACLLGLLGAYLFGAALRREPLRIREWTFRLPSASMTGGQFLVSSLDICCAAGCLYALLPPIPGLGPAAFVGSFVLAITLGALSNVPGGLGVLESALLLLLPGVEPADFLGAVLVFRVVYYLGPFGIALSMIALQELASLGSHMPRAAGVARRLVEALAPQLLAMAAFGAGAVLLVSGALPAIGTRVELLRGVVPLPLIEVSHLAGSAIGAALLIVSRGLYRRMHAAFRLTQLLLAGGIAASLVKGIDYEEALILVAVMLLLYGGRRRFYRRTALDHLRLSPFALLNVGLVILAVVWLGLMSFRDVGYSHDLFWQFAFDAGAPRMLRAASVIVLLGAGFGLWQLLKPAPLATRTASPEELERAAAGLARADDSLSNLVLLGDKQLLFSEDDAFIMYQKSGTSFVALGDPTGPACRHAELVWRFRELCDAHGGYCVFYQVTSDKLPLYLDLGLTLAKLGEEARVPLAEFSLEGKPRAELRSAHRKGEREGLSFRVIEPAEVRGQLAALERVSDQWLARKSAAEKGFSIGRFEPAYMTRFPCAIATRGEQIVAFANLHASGDGQELSVDLMRYADDAPKGVMDYLFVSLMLWGRDRGYRWFNLGMAPLSGLESHPLAPLWHKLGLLVHRYGEEFYNFDGLRRYKQKFAPVWRPRYLASPGGLALARVLLDLVTLIAGGMREVVRK